MSILVCAFQQYEPWNEYHCECPKRTTNPLICKQPYLCSHKDIIRKCEIARTLWLSNIHTADDGKIKMCGFSDRCKNKLKGEYPECNQETLKEWGECYRQKFVSLDG